VNPLVVIRVILLALGGFGVCLFLSGVVDAQVQGKANTVLVAIGVVLCFAGWYVLSGIR